MSQNSFSNTALKYGAYSAVLLFAVFLAIYFAGYNPLGNSSWLGAWVPVAFIFLGISRYKNRENYGFINFGRAFRLGFYITVSSSLLFASIVYVFGTLYDPRFVEMYKLDSMDAMDRMRNLLSQDLYEETIENIDKITIGTITTSDFIFKTIGGSIVSLIAAAILKNTELPDKNESEDIHAE